MKSAAAFESKTQLFSEDELRNLLDNAALPSSPVPVSQPTTPWRNIMIGSGILAGATAAFLLWNPLLNVPQNTLAPKSDLVSESVSQAPKTQESPVLESSAPVSTATDTPLTPAENDASLPSNIASNDRSATAPTLTTSPNSIPSKIKGLRALELSIEELAALGVHLNSGGFQLQAELGFHEDDPLALNAFVSNNSSARSQLNFKQQQLASVLKSFGYSSSGSMKFSVRIDSFSIRSTLQAQSTASAALSPLVISHEVSDAEGKENNAVLLFGNADQNAAQSARLTDETVALFDLYSAKPQARTEELSHFPLLSKLIAVRLPLIDQRGVGADVILWYYPSEEFLGLLPEKYSDRIRDELKRIEVAEQRHKADSATALIAQRERGEYRYTDVARAASGSVSILSVGPNPAHDHARIRFLLSDARDLSIVLYDMSGNRVAVLNQLNGMGSGEHEETIDCKDLPTGVYLITLVSNQGEQAIQRFIIQK